MENDIRTAPGITCSIVMILRPYWKKKVISDQDYGLVLAYLKQFEKMCRVSHAQGVQDAKGKTD